METTFTIGVGAIGILIGAGIGFGMVRGKLGEVERLVKALFKKFDDLSTGQNSHTTQIARHDERISNLQSDLREIRKLGVPTPTPSSSTGPIDLGTR